ncbi:TetR family transcriptional regulator [Sinobacterium caligoides]|uniref:TetR family transcriptional regulator n=1 Tax=Sinobacterium caligoides TaxID=933926 RepID=A0A3N2E0Z4_9GAMM|nr:TetR family transcriptional regulator [Sinobacterium caligoides]ROS05756.1 TetR family transcriptional regulator [Sinobacterium caligoides]
MAKQQTSIEYQGRKVRRPKGEERRLAILEATLRIISREGVKAVRHRAIAKEADVPLAATTYYFKQLSDLITDAFNLFVERAQINQAKLEKNSFDALKSFSLEQLSESKNKTLLADMLAKQFCRHIGEEVDRRAERVIENAFRFEATINPQLRQITHLPNQKTIHSICQFYTILGSTDPSSDATILHSVILQLEYQNLLADEFDYERTYRTLRRTIDRSLGLL